MVELMVVTARVPDDSPAKHASHTLATPTHTATSFPAITSHTSSPLSHSHSFAIHPVLCAMSSPRQGPKSLIN